MVIVDINNWALNNSYTFIFYENVQPNSVFIHTNYYGILHQQCHCLFGNFCNQRKKKNIENVKNKLKEVKHSKDVIQFILNLNESSIKMWVLKTLLKILKITSLEKR